MQDGVVGLVRDFLKCTFRFALRAFLSLFGVRTWSNSDRLRKWILSDNLWLFFLGEWGCPPLRFLPLSSPDLVLPNRAGESYVL